ncbi:hypothetical protein AAHC03_024400 [Spirometra sp. Aus1]
MGSCSQDSIYPPPRGDSGRLARSGKLPELRVPPRKEMLKPICQRLQEPPESFPALKPPKQSKNRNFQQEHWRALFREKSKLESALVLPKLTCNHRTSTTILCKSGGDILPQVAGAPNWSSQDAGNLQRSNKIKTGKKKTNAKNDIYKDKWEDF